LPVLVIEPCGIDDPEDESVGTGPRVGADAGTGQAVTVPDFDSQPEPGQRKTGSRWYSHAFRAGNHGVVGASSVVLA
jgi:hypothetical protein